MSSNVKKISARKAEAFSKSRARIQRSEEKLGRVSSRLSTVERQHEEFKAVASHPLSQIHLEGARDQLVDEIVREAIKAAKVVAREVSETGDYEIGISIPPLNIRRRIARIEAVTDLAGAVDPFAKVRRIDVSAFDK